MANRSESSLAGVVDEQRMPQITAAFLVTFDNRKGYTITWQQTLDGSKLDGSVEFKCFPSGLHKVEDDLVYFVHDDCAGISAFLRREDSEAKRNARMLSVGALVPLESGRLGKSFFLAEELKELAQTLIDEEATITPLESFWDKHKKKVEGKEDEPAQDSDGASQFDKYQKLRSLSAVSLTTPTIGRSLSPHHPALALPEMLKTFGPLIFPTCRASLLQKRILLVGEAPVESMCNFVYCLSVLSTISRADAAHIPELEAAKYHTRPLFAVGVSDIPTLESTKEPWIACTTDDVLATKPHLFDVLVIMPNASANSKFVSKNYPKLLLSTPDLQKAFPKNGIKATQRDAKRFAALRNALTKLPFNASALSAPSSPELNANGDDDDASSTSSVSTVPDDREVVEPTPWSVIAYTSLIWWASAGDRRSGLLEAEELSDEQDQELLRDSLSGDRITKEIGIVAYFHKVISLELRVLTRAVNRSTRTQREEPESDNDEQALLSAKGDDEPVEITEDDLREMGLDVWSVTDRHFVQEAIRTYWKRSASVQGGIIECCGIRLL